jgi:drug/metabolite transporter (DMT)-like permease
MPTVLLALATSALFGVGDFLGGVATRRDTPYAVTGTSHLLSFVLLAALVFGFLPDADPTKTDLVAGGVSGLSGVIGVIALFSALAVGRMSVVAPITAALSAGLPALWDLVTGTRIGAVALVGIGLALLAIVIVSIAPDDELHLPQHPYRPRLALALTVGGGFPVKRPALLPTLGAGLTDAFASVTMFLSIRFGPLALASVLGSLYPVVVAMLARVFLGEHLTALQKAGVATAMLAVVLSSLG